jgi:hypothetical protein
MNASNFVVKLVIGRRDITVVLLPRVAVVSQFYGPSCASVRCLSSLALSNIDMSISELINPKRIAFVHAPGPIATFYYPRPRSHPSCGYGFPYSQATSLSQIDLIPQNSPRG